MSSNREVAQFAATIGREFRYELLSAVVSVDEPTLQAELAKLTEAEILYLKGQLAQLRLPVQARPSRGGGSQRARRTPEAAVSPADRRSHGGALSTQSAATQPELLAHHFTEAGLAEKAVLYWLEAGLALSRSGSRM